MLKPVLESLSLEAALVVGSDWALVDPTLCDAMVERFCAEPDSHRFVYSQAAPGLCGCVVSRKLIDDLADHPLQVGSMASLGGLLSYVPASPLSDPINKPSCVLIPPKLRDACDRFIIDDVTASPLIAACHASERALDRITVDELITIHPSIPPIPWHVRVEITPVTQVSWRRRQETAPNRKPMSAEQFRSLCEQLHDMNPGAVISLVGPGDPIQHPALREMLVVARGVGIAGMHIRTPLTTLPDDFASLLGDFVDVVSVEMAADDAAAYQVMTGTTLFADVRSNLDLLLEMMRSHRNDGRSPWIVPRLTRSDAVYEQIDAWHDDMQMHAGWSVLDAVDMATSGERIAPLPLPRAARLNMARSVVDVRCDGIVFEANHEACIIGSVRDEPLGALWARLFEYRRRMEHQA